MDLQVNRFDLLPYHGTQVYHWSIVHSNPFYKQVNQSVRFRGVTRYRPTMLYF